VHRQLDAREHFPHGYSGLRGRTIRCTCSGMKTNAQRSKACFARAAWTASMSQLQVRSAFEERKALVTRESQFMGLAWRVDCLPMDSACRGRHGRILASLAAQLGYASQNPGTRPKPDSPRTEGPVCGKKSGPIRPPPPKQIACTGVIRGRLEDTGLRLSGFRGRRTGAGLHARGFRCIFCITA